MRCLLPVLASMLAVARADDQVHDDHASPSNAQIVVTINAEARVSAVARAPLPAPAPCGSPTRLAVQVINHRFITAPLRAVIAGDAARLVTIHMDGSKLTGRSEESRNLGLIPSGHDPVDLTIAFSIDNNIGDLGGRNRVHFI